MLESYIYRNLERYGNCLISNELYEKLGEKKILNDLKNHGLNCIINVVKIIEKNKMKFISGKSIIIEVIGE